jgi:hypothetical protein
MSQLTTAELNPLIHGLGLMTDETTPAGAELSRRVEIDWESGRVGIDPDALKESADQCLPETVADAFMSVSKDVMSGGVAVFKDELPPVATSPDPDAPQPVDNGLRAIPWVVISDLVQTFRGTPPALRSALGIEGAASGDEATRILREGFPYVPDWMLGGGAAELFARDPSANPFALGATQYDIAPPRPSDSGTAEASAVQASAAGEYIAAARDIILGDWSGLGGHWWGWPFGWSVGIKATTANTLADLLLGTNGGGKLFDAMYEAVKARGISAGLKAMSLTAGTAIALYAAALGLNIRAVNGKKGVRLQGNWPVIGGPGAFVWATKG